MHDWHAVFEGSAPAARDLASRLDGRYGLRCFVEDRQGPFVGPGGSRARYSVVLVPPGEEERALEVVARWEHENRREAELLGSRLARVFALSLIPPLSWGLAYLALPGSIPEPTLGWVLVAWLASLVAIARIEHRRRRRERVGFSGVQ